MKTVQFHRNKQELRNELLSFLNVGRQKSKSKSKSRTNNIEKKVNNNSIEKHPNRSQSRQKQQQPLHNNNNGLKIKLKLKKKAQNQTIKNNNINLLQKQLQHYPLQQLPSKNLNQNIKKAIQKQLLSSFYKSSTTIKKQIDNRRTAYRQQSQDEQNLQKSQQQQSLLKLNGNKFNKKCIIKRSQQFIQQKQKLTNDRKQRCSRIQKQRNKQMINSFLQQDKQQFKDLCNINDYNINVRQTATNQLSQSHQQSIKFIPEDEVYIPKSFVTFTVKRKEFRNSCDKKDLLSSNDKNYQEQNQVIKMMRTKTQAQECRQGSKKNRSLSSIQQFQSNISNVENQLQKKMAFYNRHNSINTNNSNNNNNKPLTSKSSSSLKKQSTLIRTIKSVNNNEVQVIQYKQQQRKQIMQIVESKSKRQKTLTVQNYSKANMPSIKMTQSLYEGKQQQQQTILSSKQSQKHPLNYQQQSYTNEPSLSLTSSLNYSTPIPSLQQSDSKQLTINKLSTISKQPQQQRRIMHSLSIETTNNNDHINNDQSKLLRFSQQKQDINKKSISKNDNNNVNIKNDDLLTTSLTKFKQYEQRKEQILRQKQSMKNIQNKNIKNQIIVKHKKLDKQSQSQHQKQKQQFNDFDQIFLQANQMDIVDKLRQYKQNQQYQQQKQYQKLPEKDNNKQSIQKEFNSNKNKNKNKQKPNANVVTIPTLEQRHVQSKQPNIKPPTNKLTQDKKIQQQQQVTQQQKQIKQKDQTISQLPPPQLSINQSSITQQSVSDFTPQPSLAEIKINDQPLLITIKQDDKNKNIQQNKQQQPLIQNLQHQLQQKSPQNQQQQQKYQQQQQKQQSIQKHELSLNQFQDYEFNNYQSQIKNNNNNNNDKKDKKHLQFDDFPQWKYNDNRDNVPEQVINKIRQNQQKQLKLQIIPFEIKSKNQFLHKQQASKTQQQSLTNQINKNPQLQLQTILPINEQSNQQTINQITRPKSTTISNKVRLIQNIQLSSSSSQSSETQSDNNDINDGQKNNQMNQHVPNWQEQKQSQKLKTQYDQTIQNRYYSSSDQQQQHRKQQSQQQAKNMTLTNNQKSQKPRQQTKLTLKKQTSIKKTFNNNNTTNYTSKTKQQQKTKQKIIPLGIKVTKPKDLFPVLQDSQEWNYGSESVGEIERNSIVQNDQKNVNNKKDNQSFNQKSSISKSFKQKQKEIFQKDEQLDLLQKQFSQPPPAIKSQKSKQIINTKNTDKILIKNKQSQQQKINKSLSDFSQSQQKNSSNNLTQSLSDFLQDQLSLSQAKNTQVVVQNNPTENNKNHQPFTKPPLKTTKRSLPTANNNQLNEIKKQRKIVHDLKYHVNQLLKRISSQHSISAQQQQQQHNHVYQQKQKQNNSFLSNHNQPSIKPVSMSFESSQGSQINDRESFVQQYEEDNVKKSIVRSKHEQSRKSIEKKKNLFKKYEKDNNNKRSEQFIERNPLFDFSDKNSSDHEVSKQNNSSSVKKYSQHDSDQSFQYKKSHTQQQQSSSNQQTSLQQKNKQDVLKQFDNLAKLSQKDFSKNKSYYLKHKQKDEFRQNKNVYKNDRVNEDLPILMPKTGKRVVKDNVKSIDRQSQQQGSSGQTINHKQLEIIPQSLYVTNAKNTTTTNQLKLSQMQPRQSLKNKKGLSVSKKMSSNSNEQLNSSSGFGKSFSGVMNGSQSEHNQSINLTNQKGMENQFLWNFIMKK